MATVFQVPDALGMTFGITEPPRITGTEISVDAYPDDQSDLARAKLLGAQKDDVMIRLMDKLIDTQNRKAGTADVSEDHRKRVRIEVTLKGIELHSLGLDRLPDLRDFKFTTLQGKYFQFKLPTFPVDMEESKSGLDAVKAERKIWRVKTFARTGIVGLMAMEAEREAGKKAGARVLKWNLKIPGRKK
ncbi:hypothetical protein [Paracoccus alkanivorans]|uniref:Uncharacterized protein n=1 Tax=Paracoccus alkanivorans TaxID=2116655 RepID=A0A3M0M9J8_9RHOB|nr:hypothetical protein [Paracoccus alkanivorans]RMC34402.1 hypothetical protein C9E81_14765 [Paracoccus alkanivorans]